MLFQCWRYAHRRTWPPPSATLFHVACICRINHHRSARSYFRPKQNILFLIPQLEQHANHQCEAKQIIASTSSFLTHTHDPSLFQSSCKKNLTILRAAHAKLSVGTNASHRTVCQRTRTGNRLPQHAKSRQVCGIASAPSTNTTVASNLAVRLSRQKVPRGWTTKKKKDTWCAHVGKDAGQTLRPKHDSSAHARRCAPRSCRIGMRRSSMRQQ